MKSLVLLLKKAQICNILPIGFKNWLYGNTGNNHRILYSFNNNPKLIKCVFLQRIGLEIKFSSNGGPVTEGTVKALNNIMHPDVLGGLLALQTMEDNRGTTLNENFHSFLKRRLGV